ncbi:MAG: hypothetical protein ACQESC_02215 [Nanobdellota archaeon]
MKHALNIGFTHELQPFNAVDIGTNKSHLQTKDDPMTITERVSKLIKSLPEVNNIRITGSFIDHLQKNHPKLANRLKKSLLSHQTTLLPTTYYGSLPEILPHQELEYQQRLQSNSLKSWLSENEHNLLCTSKETQPLLPYADLDDSIQHLQQHLLDELQELHPHIKTIDDSQLLSLWRKIATPEVVGINSLNTHGSPYEKYISVLNTINDMVHTIRTFTNLQEGKTILAPTISEHPSQLLAQPQQ